MQKKGTFMCCRVHFMQKIDFRSKKFKNLGYKNRYVRIN